MASEWNFLEDARPGGGKAFAFQGRSETVWIIKTEFPRPGTMGRLIIREWEDGTITVERGRVWMPGPEEDGA